MAGMYMIMSFWMPTIRAQLFFVSIIQHWGQKLSACKNTCFISAALYLLFNSLSTSGWVGLAALMPVLGALVPCIHLWVCVGQMTTPYLLNYTRGLLFPESIKIRTEVEYEPNNKAWGSAAVAPTQESIELCRPSA
jgi:hypothetical protein